MGSQALAGGVQPARLRLAEGPTCPWSAPGKAPGGAGRNPSSRHPPDEAPAFRAAQAPAQAWPPCLPVSHGDALAPFVVASVVSLAQIASVNPHGFCHLLQFLARGFPPHNHPTSLCNLEKVSKHLLSVGSPFSKRVPRGVGVTPASPALLAQRQRTRAQGEEVMVLVHSSHRCLPSTHCLQEGFLAVGKGINRMQGICSLRTHSLMEKMVPIEIIEIIVPSDKNNKI